ncbi:MAG: cell division protein SepF [Candidatus Margulisbacteria bacterium]|nr:cell division protein SepF [Candidatus Margulisiibacteriota bacterium]
MGFFKSIVDFLGFGIEDKNEPQGNVGKMLSRPAPPAEPEQPATTLKIPEKLDKEKTNILIIEPRNLDTDSQEILRLLKEGHVVIINNKYLDTPNTRTLMDRVLGVVYAFDGNLQKIGGGIFLCAPRSVNVVDDAQNEIIFNEDFAPAPAAPVQAAYAATGTYDQPSVYTPASAYAAAPAPQPAARPAGAQSYYY